MSEGRRLGRWLARASYLLLVLSACAPSGPADGGGTGDGTGDSESGTTDGETTQGACAGVVLPSGSQPDFEHGYVFDERTIYVAEEWVPPCDPSAVVVGDCPGELLDVEIEFSEPTTEGTYTVGDQVEVTRRHCDEEGGGAASADIGTVEIYEVTETCVSGFVDTHSEEGPDDWLEVGVGDFIAPAC